MNLPTKSKTIVLEPGCSFAEMNATLTALGWRSAADTSVAPPIIPDEPEFASWSRADDDGDGEVARISYTFNPVVHLRVLVFYGSRAGGRSAEVEKALPTLDIAGLPELLRSAEPRQLLLGVFAARELKAIPVIELLEPLRNHYESAVARAAQKAYAELVELTLEIGAAHLRQEKRRHPDRSVLFPRLGDAPMRRQTLRWLIRDYKESNQHIDEVLRSALVDDDWEVRASAMLAAVRLGATAVGGDVKRMALPRTSREGPDETDRSILHELRKIALAHLADEPFEDADAASDERALLRRHLWRCMIGYPVERHDRIFLFINALTEPLEIEGEGPPALKYVEEADGLYRLEQTGIELCWVPPLPHWLGSDDPDLTVPNVIRRATPQEGFFITRRPLSVAQARSLGSSVIASDQHPTSDELYLCNQVEAARLCELLGRLEGAHIGLPEADQWEMAARGTDGRRYPWGNGFERDPKELSSPWGLEQTVGYQLQWTTTKKETNVGIVCGGETDLRCSFRHEVLLNDEASLFAVRLVVRPGSTVG